MAISERSAVKAKIDHELPIEWLDGVERIRGKLILIEGLLASLVLDHPNHGRERLGKALLATDSVFETVDELAVSLRQYVRSSARLSEVVGSDGALPSGPKGEVNKD